MTMAPQNHINICSDPILKEYLAKQGIQAQVFDSVLNYDEKVKMLEDLDKFASGWFMSDKHADYTDYRNVSIGASLHDEIRTFFHLLLHFARIIKKIGGNVNITFYHSASCLMPDVIINFLTDCRVRIELIDAQYPWLSLKEQHESQITRNFSRIAFNHGESKKRKIKDQLRQIKSALKQCLSKLFFKIFSKSKRNLYLHAFRSLMPLYRKRFADADSSYNVYITDTTPFKPESDMKHWGILNEIFLLFQLARKGIAVDSLRHPFYYHWYVSYEKKSEYQILRDDFCLYHSKSVQILLEEGSDEHNNFFSRQLRIFYLNHLVDFMKLIDFYYEKFSKLKIDLCLQEMCHPFQAQVLANLGICCYLLPSNHILHNQYFAPRFLEKVENRLIPLSFSSLDAERFAKLGFNGKNILALPAALANICIRKTLALHQIDSLKGKKILILAPSIIALDTFRYQIQSERLYNFFSELFEVLSEIQIKSVTIRSHPGSNVPRNRFGHTDNDIFKYLIGKVPERQKNFQLIFSDSYFHNVSQDILNNDIVIANLSGALFEVLALGRDYVYFDDTLTPNYGGSDWTVFNEGTIKKLKTKEDLRKHLLNYAPPDLESLRRKLFQNDSFFRGESGDLNLLNLL